MPLMQDAFDRIAKLPSQEIHITAFAGVPHAIAAIRIDLAVKVNRTVYGSGSTIDEALEELEDRCREVDQQRGAE